jgi:quinohemoprotein ethanol dehydrogenase
MRILVIFLLIQLVSTTYAKADAQSQPSSSDRGRIDQARMANADADPGQWLTVGRDTGQTYFSPLTGINKDNVKSLGFAWQYQLETNRGLEASPIVVDGIMYSVGNFGRVYALNAATGELIWRFVPDVDMHWARHACCDAVNRGVAVWKGKVYVAALDGILYSLDAATGKVVWKADTFLGRDKPLPYTSTGAPAVTKDTVIIGNAGADFEGIRGYVSAYDLETGKLKWRFFTVPRDPALGPQDQPHLKKAISTWDPRHQWKAGGGGTVWDGLIYDPATNLIFFGTGNVSPYNTRQGGRKGGDALYACSVVAVHADSGELAWYFQEVPDDRWDFDSTQKLILTTLPIGGQPRDVLLHAPKNGFLYVYDRHTGEVLAVNKFAYVNWTKGLDPETHRPIPNPAAEYHEKPAIVWPSAIGAHSWQPMSFDPKTGLVYIPVIENPNVLLDLTTRPAQYSDGWFDIQGIFPDDYHPADLVDLYGRLPSIRALAQDQHGPLEPRGELTAIDPVSGRIAWRAAAATIWDGGVTSTAGGIVLQGDAAGKLNIYADDTGRLLQTVDVGTGIMDAPITYTVAGAQYVAFMAGFGGTAGFAFAPSTAAYKYDNTGRIVALKLGGGAVPRPAERKEAAFQKPFAPRPSHDQAVRGEILYTKVCSRCHVFGPGMLPDLRRISEPTYQLFFEIVLRGAFVPKGMGQFSDELTQDQAADIRAFLTDEAWKAFEGQPATHTGQAH